MDKFDIRSAKLVSIIGLILFIFVMVIANAYNYLPKEEDNKSTVNTQISLPSDNEEEQAAEDINSPSKDSISQKEETKSENETVVLPSKNEIPPLENFSNEEELNEDVQPETVEDFESVIKNANQMTTEKKFVNAISEYQKAINLAKDSNEKASCYEGIATVYALAKKYGTALSYAQKAYNLSPSTKREILLARLYYKTGDADKASERINNVIDMGYSFRC